MKTLTEKYRGVLNESFSKAQFVRDARMAQPSLINQFTSYNDAVSILKSKGMISEEDKLPEYAEFENISDEAIRRGIDAELEGMGLMSHDSVSEEDQAKAKDKALKNLKKDPLHYLNLLSGESNKVDKHDKPVEFKKGKEVDTFNGMKKADLKEEAGIPTAFDNENMEALLQIVLKYVEDPDEAEAAVQKVDDHGLDSLAPELLANLDRDEEYKAWYKDLHGMAESNQEESIANFIIKHYTNPKTGKSLIDDEIIGDFFETHPESRDQEPEDALDNFEEYLSVNYEMPGDYMQEKVAKSVEDVIDPADYGMIGQGYLKGFNRPHSLSDDDLEVLGRKVVDSLYKGDFDAAKAKFMGEVMGIDRKGNKKPETGGSDATKYKAAAKNMEEELSDEDMKAIEKYGREDKPVKAFKPGDMFSSDFDYEGMLEFGMKIRLNTNLDTLQALYDSFEDVNYHSENSHLGMAIDAIKDGDKSEALDHIRNFKKAIKKTLIQFNEGANPNRDVEEYVDPKSKLFRPGSTDDGEEMNERVGSLQEFIALIQDRAAENDTTEAEEAEEVMYALGEHYNLGVDIMHSPNEGKGKDHDGDKDVDGDEHMVHEVIGDLFAPGNARYHLDMPVEKIAEALKDHQDSLTAQGVKDAMDLYDKLAADGTLEKGISIVKAKHIPKLKKAFNLIGLYGSEVSEKKGKDHDGDGDVDKDDYMAAKDKAIKKAMGKDEIVKENIKAIISKVLEEGTINEAATQELAKMTDAYGGFEGMKSVLLQLQDVVTDIESYYDKTRGKIQKAFDAMGGIRNEEGLKVGGFLAPAIETAFIKDLRPVTRQGFTKGLDQPKVRVISQRDIDRHNSGEAPLGEAEPVKDTVYTPTVNGTLRETKK